MRLLVLLGVGALAWAQPPDPAYEPLARAYAALKAKDYDAAVAGFRAAGARWRRIVRRSTRIWRTPI
jgi:hypothetical protein